MVHYLRGMFAFAIWDEARRGLFLARDPYGIKLLYTANDGWTFCFASQQKRCSQVGASRAIRRPGSACPPKHGWMRLLMRPNPVKAKRPKVCHTRPLRQRLFEANANLRMMRLVEPA
jgi:asparagine synthetase B (glutamine-hydrolysing)